MISHYPENFWELDLVERNRILWPVDKILFTERVSRTSLEEFHRLQCNSVNGFLNQFSEEK